MGYTKFKWNPFNDKYDERKKNFVNYVKEDPAPRDAFNKVFKNLTDGKAPSDEDEDIFSQLLMRFYTAECIDKVDADEDTIRVFIYILPLKLATINDREDKADFDITDLLRFLYQLPITADYIKKKADSDDKYRVTIKGRHKNPIDAITEALLSFKYWPDEPGKDSMWFFTENHYIMFSVCEYLAGQMFPNDVFTNSSIPGKITVTGKDKMEKARKRLVKWIGLRFYTGFSEWFSNVYYPHDMNALLNLAEFSKDDTLSRNASTVLSLLVADLALNSLHGNFGSTHGRSYTKHNVSFVFSPMGNITMILFGMGFHDATVNSTAVFFAMSEKYILPDLLFRIAADTAVSDLENRQRSGIRLEDMALWELDPGKDEDVMHLLTLDAFADPLTLNPVLRLFKDYGIWGKSKIFGSFGPIIKGLTKVMPLDKLVNKYKEECTAETREQVNTYTYKTPEYMLSSAQDYRRGYGGYQQHLWQATIYPDPGPGRDYATDNDCAVIFATHPCREPEEGLRSKYSPGYWVGSGTLPRVAQVKNVAIICHKILKGNFLRRYFKPKDFSHAYLNSGAFANGAELEYRNNWMFGRKGRAYIALYSYRPLRWRTDDPFKLQELVADDGENIWICEMGSGSSDADFKKFKDGIAAAAIACNGSMVAYDSPSRGFLSFGWDVPFTRRDPQTGKDVPIAISDYGRYENPYAAVPFPENIGKQGYCISFQHEGKELKLKLE